MVWACFLFVWLLWVFCFCLFFINHKGSAVELGNYHTLTPRFLFCYLLHLLNLSFSSLLNLSCKLFDTDSMVFDTSVAAVYLISRCYDLLMVLVRET